MFSELEKLYVVLVVWIDWEAKKGFHYIPNDGNWIEAKANDYSPQVPEQITPFMHYVIQTIGGFRGSGWPIVYDSYFGWLLRVNYRAMREIVGVQNANVHIPDDLNDTLF